jgi:hypothetical protein
MEAGTAYFWASHSSEGLTDPYFTHPHKEAAAMAVALLL